MKLIDPSPDVPQRKREDGSLGLTSDGKFARRVCNESEEGSFLQGISFDALSATYPNALTEIYEYYDGGLAGTLVATVTVVYTDATKTAVSTVVKT